MAFHDAQLQAIRHKDGPMLVLAGPGSGKTLVITERTHHLIQECDISPSNILVITFTKAAAMEMKERFEKRIGRKNCPVTFGTFHAVFFAILKNAYGYSAKNIVREDQKFSCIKSILNKHHIEYEDENEFVNSLLGEIGLVKNSGIELADYYSQNCAEEVFRRIYSDYHEYLYQHKLIDFEDMLLYTYELFAERGDILAAWQNKFRYILVDEFQDINKIQFDVVKMLAGENRNLFVVGDDDQSIYRFRGSKPEIMLHFKDDYPEAKTVLLDINYRSNANVVERACNLISYNKERYDKPIKAAQERGSEVEYALFAGQDEENERIIDDIQSYVAKGGHYSDIAVLYRTNTQPRLLVEQLMAYNIPFHTRDNVPNLYEHWIARDVRAYLRIAHGSRARKDFLQIMNRPMRYLSRASLEEETVAYDAWIGFYEDSEQQWMVERIEKLESDCAAIARMNPFAAINYIRHGIGYDAFCTEYAEERKIKTEDLMHVLDELQDSTKGYRTFAEWEDHIEDYTKELEEMKKTRDAITDSVSLATLHSSKGLEYDHVYLIDVNEGVMPYKKAALDAELEEERRMFYVGMTRAKKNLHLFSVKELNHKDAEISRFIKESQVRRKAD